MIFKQSWIHDKPCSNSRGQGGSRCLTRDRVYSLNYGLHHQVQLKIYKVFKGKLLESGQGSHQVHRGDCSFKPRPSPEVEF